MRSSRVSPMPIRMPVVNGTRSSPAIRIVSSRAAGILVGRAEVRAARSHSRADALSSMMPCETDTVRSATARRASMHPGLTCGSSPVSSSTSAPPRPDRQSWCVTERVELFARSAVAQLGLVAQSEQRLLAAGRLPGRAIPAPRRARGTRGSPVARRLRERAVVATSRHSFVSGTNTLREYDTTGPCARSLRAAAARINPARSSDPRAPPLRRRPAGDRSGSCATPEVGCPTCGLPMSSFPVPDSTSDPHRADTRSLTSRARRRRSARPSAPWCRPRRCP